MPTDPPEMPAPSATNGALWLLLRGASAAVAAGWLAWVAGAVVLGPRLVAGLGEAGASIVLLAGGWLLARHVAVPLEWLRRYHLDDVEIAVLGPGRRVRRLAWDRVATVTQERGALRLGGDGVRASLPLGPALRSGAWSTLLSRVVPALAGAMWARLEDGEEVHLHAPLEPRLEGLVWWAWGPALLACLVAGSGAESALVLALGERLVAFARAHAASVSLHRTGVAVRAGLRSLFVSWRRAGVVRAPHGLVVGPTEGRGGVVSAGLPNFWAAAPVIETRAQLGAGFDACVTFRVRVADGRLAVVGEIDPAA